MKLIINEELVETPEQIPSGDAFVAKGRYEVKNLETKDLIDGEGAYEFARNSDRLFNFKVKSDDPYTQKYLTEVAEHISEENDSENPLLGTKG